MVLLERVTFELLAVHLGRAKDSCQALEMSRPSQEAQETAGVLFGMTMGHVEKWKAEEKGWDRWSFDCQSSEFRLYLVSNGGLLLLQF